MSSCPAWGLGEALWKGQLTWGSPVLNASSGPREACRSPRAGGMSVNEPRGPGITFYEKHCPCLQRKVTSIKQEPHLESSQE